MSLKFEQQSLQNFAENAYLNYSMYVIMDRALPFIGDGLKPVQRRIVYAMSELHLDASAKFKKSARTVGDVLGKYHPHGDSACYEAMVLMAQSFSYRYPLIDGQGNWGSPDDPKSFAAMRYTESRLSRYSSIFLDELGKGTVDFIPNFDGTMNEPKMLPARLPNILLNGTTGIAVGMATDIPSHNLNEIVDAIIALIEKPNLQPSDLMKFVKAPDFPTLGEIISSNEDILKIYETGKGSLRQRAVWRKENNEIVVTDLPYQASGAKIIEQIAQQMRAKKLPLIEDLRDESDHENPTRIVIVPKSSRADLDQIMLHLFASTDLEKSYRVNMNMIGLDGKPAVKNLSTILNEWILFRRQTIENRLKFRLEKVENRLHILVGFLIVYLNLDEIIQILRDEDEPKSILMQKFKLSEIQVESILEIRLRQLAKLEEIKLRGEQENLQKEKLELEAILNSTQKLNNLMKNELLLDKKQFGEKRKSPICAREEAKILQENMIIPNEPVTIILSKMGWIRCAKGHEIDPLSLSYKSGDSFKMAVQGKSNQNVIFFDSSGRTYSTEAQNLPSARGQGEPLSRRFSLPSSHTTFESILAENEHPILIASDSGYGFICHFTDLVTKNKNGKAVLSLSDNAKILPPIILNEHENWILVISNLSRMLVFPRKSLPILSKGKGNKMIGISTEKAKNREEFIQFIAAISENVKITLFSGKRKITFSFNELEKYRAERGRKGGLLPRGFDKITQIKIE